MKRMCFEYVPPCACDHGSFISKSEKEKIVVVISIYVVGMNHYLSDHFR